MIWNIFFEIMQMSVGSRVLGGGGEGEGGTGSIFILLS